MTSFLVVFDRMMGRTLEVRHISSDSGYAAIRLDAEDKYRANPDIEVVVLSADSEENLRRTHGRYFESFAGLAGQALGRGVSLNSGNR